MLQAWVKGVHGAEKSEDKVRSAETTGHINYAIPHPWKGRVFFILLFGNMEEEHGL